jgi:hypothetical protein
MRITERKLRRIIRSVIRESAGSQGPDRMRPGSWDDLASSRPTEWSPAEQDSHQIFDRILSDLDDQIGPLSDAEVSQAERAIANAMETNSDYNQILDAAMQSLNILIP